MTDDQVMILNFTKYLYYRLLADLLTIPMILAVYVTGGCGKIDPSGEWCCTERRGHSGDHVATTHDGDRVADWIRREKRKQ